MIMIVTIILSGLVAGLFYGYTCSVNPGLRQLSDKEYLNAMKSINRAILNPVFFLSFIGSVFVFAAALFQLNSKQQAAFYYMLAAAVIYVVGVFGITMFVNVPLNNRLSGFNVEGATRGDLVEIRTLFEKPWNTFHIVRTLASILSFILSVLSFSKIK